jgi:hypothetical protein
MLAKKRQKLTQVAGIGLKRFWRQPPFRAQVRQPVRHLKRDIFSGAGKFDRLNRGNRFGHGFVLGTQGRAMIPVNISHLFRLPFANLARSSRGTLAPTGP